MAKRKNIKDIFKQALQMAACMLFVCLIFLAAFFKAFMALPSEERQGIILFVFIGLLMFVWGYCYIMDLPRHHTEVKLVKRRTR